MEGSGVFCLVHRAGLCVVDTVLKRFAMETFTPDTRDPNEERLDIAFESFESNESSSTGSMSANVIIRLKGAHITQKEKILI